MRRAVATLGLDLRHIGLTVMHAARAPARFARDRADAPRGEGLLPDAVLQHGVTRGRMDVPEHARTQGCNRALYDMVHGWPPRRRAHPIQLCVARGSGAAW